MMDILERYRYISSEFKDFSESNTFSFKKRLARENNWSDDFCDAITEEYLKFCVLALYVDHSVTPSDEVDQVWHLHLQYTEHYLEVFCERLLNTKFYHGPTKGGQSERVKYHDQYNQTITSYERYFGPVNRAYWPVAEARFGRLTHYQRVNIADHFVVPKRSLISLYLAILMLLVSSIVHLTT